MYSEIASNKRRSVVFIIVFFLIWMGVGAVLGLLFAALYHPVNQYTGAVTKTGDSPIFVGIAIFAVLAFFGFLYSIRSGAALVLRVSGASPADQARTSSSTTWCRRWPSAKASRCRPSTSSTTRPRMPSPPG